MGAGERHSAPLANHVTLGRPLQLSSAASLFCCIGRGSTRETEPGGAMHQEISYKELAYTMVRAGFASPRSEGRPTAWSAGEISYPVKPQRCPPVLTADRLSTHPLRSS